MAENEGALPSFVRGMQIVSAGLLLGTLTMATAFVYLKTGPMPGRIVNFGFPLVTTAASVLLALAGCIVLFVLPGRIAGQIENARRTQPGGNAFQQVYMANHIVSSALMEGATILALQAFLLESEWTALAIAGVGFAFLASLFPTQAKFDSFVANRGAEMRDT